MDDWKNIVAALHRCSRLKKINCLEWSTKALDPPNEMISELNLQQMRPALVLPKEHLMVGEAFPVLVPLLHRQKVSGIVKLDLR